MQQVQFKKANFRIIGLSPLLCNNPYSMVLLEAWKKENGDISKLPPYEDASMRLYTEAGKYVLPITQFREALLWGCKGFKLKKSGAASVMASSVFFIPQAVNMVLINQATKKPFSDFEIDTRWAVVGEARIPRSRPMFANWGGEVSFNYDFKRIDLSVIEEKFNNGGETSGVGDYRVSSGGWFGRFNAEIKK